MTTHIDIATALLTATLHTGISEWEHAAVLAPMLNECWDTTTEAVEMVKRRLNPELTHWVDHVVAIARSLPLTPEVA